MIATSDECVESVVVEESTLRDDKKIEHFHEDNSHPTKQTMGESIYETVITSKPLLSTSLSSMSSLPVNHDGKPTSKQTSVKFSPDASGAKFQTQNSVRFDDSIEPSSDDSSSGLLPISIPSGTTEEAQNAVRQLQCDLSAERAMRRKKDKSIVKLAKQLKVCVGTIEAKERQVLKMAQTICDLEELLHNHHRELAEDQEKIRRVCRESEQRIEEYEHIVQVLRKELFEANLEIDLLKTQLRKTSESTSHHGADLINNNHDSSHDFVDTQENVMVLQSNRVTRRLAVVTVAGIALAVAARFLLKNRESSNLNK